MTIKQKRVLIVSESHDRKAFLEYHLRKRNLRPVWYPNILAASMTARLDPFVMVIVDLSIPVQPKLALIEDCAKYQTDALVVSIGKTEYLEKEQALPQVSRIMSLSSIESVPVFLKEWGTV